MKEEVDDVTKWILAWITCMDNYVCDDCTFRQDEEEDRTLDEWGLIGLPGSGCTICKEKCRCLLLPSSLMEAFPTLRGQTIDIRADEKLRISEPLDYEDYTHLDSKIGEYEKMTDNWNLPKSYYDLYDVEERIDFVEKLIEDIDTGNLSDEMRVQLMMANPFLKGKL